MNRKYALVLLFFISVKVFPQNAFDNYELGYFFDINFQTIDGYYDIDYEPEKSFNVSYIVGEDFTPGYYYDLENNKNLGLLKYSQYNTFFTFKTDDLAQEQVIKPDECLGYVIGVDSFTVIQDFKVQREIGGIHSNKREYAEVIDRVGELTFYKHIRAGLNNVITTYLYKADSSDNYISFPKGLEKFKATAIEVFGEYESFKAKILAGRYREDDIPVLVKLLKYKRKLDSHEKIFYNVAWDEVDDSHNSSYYALVESLQDSLFHLKFYFNDGTSIYEGDFSSFYPHKKAEEFTWYYPDGTVRKTVHYKNNKPQKVVTYFKNGKVHYEYRMVNEKPVYTKVFDVNGEEKLNNSGTGIEVFYDSIIDRQITREFVHNELIASWYLDLNNRKVYQLCQKNAKLRGFKSFQTKLATETEYPLNSVKDFTHGFVLARCIIEPSGLVSELEILKGIDVDCNGLILDFLKETKTSEHWKPASMEKEQVAQELLIPIDFSIRGFSRYRNNYNNFWMMNHMTMQQQMMMMMPPPNLPSVPAPRGF